MYSITLISLDGSCDYVKNAEYKDIPFKTECRAVFSTTRQLLKDHLKVHHYHAIIAPGNGHGHMTGGFDGALVEALGQYIDTRVREEIETNWLGELPVGNAFVLPLERRGVNNIVYAPTMRGPRKLADNSSAPYSATLAAFQAIWQWNKTQPNHISKILLPVMGMGTGLLPIDRVARQMQLALIRATTGTPVRDLRDDGFLLDLSIRK